MARAMTAQRILVVDDEADVRAAVEGVLQRAGYVVQTQDSGFGLSVAVREFRPDLVLMDVHMPGLRGTAALKAMAALAHPDLPSVPVVLFSGLPAADLVQMQAQVGAAGVLHKPVTPKEIRACVEHVLGRAQEPSPGAANA
jgi:CheY-like chemotaxis protein